MNSYERVFSRLRNETVDRPPNFAIMMQGTPQQVSDAVHKCAELGGERWICGAGCEIPDGTPVENLHAQSDTLWG